MYVTRQQTSDEVAKMLTSNGLNAKAYHAGMKQDDRKEIQEEFMQSDDLIICATIAFGMGIDKSNIRYVYHYNPPKSLEGYAQEVGRAGRDGEFSHCEVLYNGADLPVLEAFSYASTPTYEGVEQLFQNFFFPSEQVNEMIKSVNPDVGMAGKRELNLYKIAQFFLCQFLW